MSQRTAIKKIYNDHINQMCRFKLKYKIFKIYQLFESAHFIEPCCCISFQ